MLTLTKKYSLTEYFDREILSETRNEYIDGEINPMTGGTPTHNTLVVNLLSLLHIALPSPYRVFVTDQRLWIPDRKIATYPDVMVIAEPLEYQEGRKDTLVNPILIAEILSPSTASYDRIGKFASYRTIPSFKEYLLISQDRQYVEHFYKEGDRWIFTAYENDAAISLASFEVAIATSVLYKRINFELETLE
ncbi:Uma2 family endonuclease [Pseudanabaena sp. UWO310]|uniref:Uma2 family endonuclease n=1 Tax=Pseudanabaena sp. UWO310 TaxID=2480795 RepID=UPI00116106BA|nr:Uma2 family endonuclease [Pseudanabaena sp. UWO310]TYQ23508.1 Uma2 family endonuclease [Pseudanabaena sp. UWO310]